MVVKYCLFNPPCIEYTTVFQQLTVGGAGVQSNEPALIFRRIATPK